MPPCSRKQCPHPGLVECFTCMAERCAAHVKKCDRCGQYLCHGQAEMCFAVHHCVPPAPEQTTHKDRVLETLERAER